MGYEIYLLCIRILSKLLIKFKRFFFSCLRKKYMMIVIRTVGEFEAALEHTDIAGIKR